MLPKLVRRLIAAALLFGSSLTAGCVPGDYYYGLDVYGLGYDYDYPYSDYYAYGPGYPYSPYPYDPRYGYGPYPDPRYDFGYPPYFG